MKEYAPKGWKEGHVKWGRVAHILSRQVSDGLWH